MSFFAIDQNPLPETGVGSLLIFGRSQQSEYYPQAKE
jgi:hypothetical protein